MMMGSICSKLEITTIQRASTLTLMVTTNSVDTTIAKESISLLKVSIWAKMGSSTILLISIMIMIHLNSTTTNLC